MTIREPSLTGRAWQIGPSARNAGDGAPFAERLASLFPVDAPDRFFTPSLARDLHDPILLGGMADAVQRIQDAVHAGERIAVFGDYDVDGLTGTAVLVSTIRRLGGKVAAMIPSRLTEGYGLSDAAVRAAADGGASVLITVDCGISNRAEIAVAVALGLSVIVCDHHELPAELPSGAVALLHPRKPGETYPFPHLTGVGVAFKLAQALLLDAEAGAELLDFAALGTLADQGALTGENRAIVRLGLDRLSRRARPGLRALLALTRIEDAQLTEEHVHFQLAPRLNAAGRMAHPRTALHLLLTQNPSEAEGLARELESLNLERRTRTEALFREILARLEAEPPTQAVVLQDPSWSVGVLGLLCSRVAERMNLPTVLMEERGDHCIGSARSVPGFDVHAALSSARDLFEKFGGHAQAAGFTLPTRHLAAFRERFIAACASAPRSEEPLALQLAVSADELTLGNARALRRFAPFGAGFPAPTLYLPGATVANAQTMGDGSHARIVLRGRQSLTAFRFGSHVPLLPPGTIIDAALTLGSSTWRGEERVEARVVDLRLSAAA